MEICSDGPAAVAHVTHTLLPKSWETKVAVGATVSRITASGNQLQRGLGFHCRTQGGAGFHRRQKWSVGGRHSDIL